MNKYVFKKYDSRYPRWFANEKKRIRRILGRAVVVEHIGSTAIPGLGGKGILDIAIATNSLRALKSKLEQNGYEFRAKASTPNRLFFRRDLTVRGGLLRLHLHSMRTNDKELVQILSFRDYLLKNPQGAKEYARIKRVAAALCNGDGEIYKQHKATFILRNSTPK